MRPGTPLQTRHVVATSGVDRETLRFYEQKGLLPNIGRSSSGYRHYPPDTPLRLQFIKMAQDVGFTLREIKLMLSVGLDGRVPSERLQKMGMAKLQELDERIRNLRRVRRTLATVLSELELPYPEGECRVLTAFKKNR